jgi:DNA-dependent protein kinase catalytic subunit
MSTPFIGSILRICHDYGEANIAPELISKVAIRSSNQHLGITLIEKQIQHYEPKERSAKRQKTGKDALDPERNGWIELSRIYKSIDEKDIFKSIYECKVATTEATKDAIAAEVIGDYDLAVKIYFEGIMKHFANEVHADETEQIIWAHGRLECLEHLGDWDYLEANMMSDLDNNLQELWTEDYQDPYLHYFLTSYIKLADGKREDTMLEPWTADNPNPLFQFIDDAMNNPEHRQILTTQHQPGNMVKSLHLGSPHVYHGRYRFDN